MSFSKLGYAAKKCQTERDRFLVEVESIKLNHNGKIVQKSTVTSDKLKDQERKKISKIHPNEPIHGLLTK